MALLGEHAESEGRRQEGDKHYFLRQRPESEESFVYGSGASCDDSRARSACRRRPRWHDAYTGQWLEYDLVGVRPRQGSNTLQFVLSERPKDFEGAIAIDDVELIVEYGVFPTG